MFYALCEFIVFAVGLTIAILAPDSPNRHILFVVSGCAFGAGLVMLVTELMLPGDR